MTKGHFHLDIEGHCLLEGHCSYKCSSQPKLSHATGSGNIMITAAAEFAGIGYYKITKIFITTELENSSENIMCF